MRSIICRRAATGCWRIEQARCSASRSRSCSDPAILARLDIALPETDPPGNLVQNPDGRLSYVNPDIPYCWRKYGDSGWNTEDIPVNAKQYSTYRCVRHSERSRGKGHSLV